MDHGENFVDVVWLLSEASEIGLSWRTGCRPADNDELDALKAAFIGTLRRRWGMAALRANARLLLERLAVVAVRPRDVVQLGGCCTVPERSEAPESH